MFAAAILIEEEIERMRTLGQEHLCECVTAPRFKDLGAVDPQTASVVAVLPERIDAGLVDNQRAGGVYDKVFAVWPERKDSIRAGAESPLVAVPIVDHGDVRIDLLVRHRVRIRPRLLFYGIGEQGIGGEHAVNVVAGRSYVPDREPIGIHPDQVA